MSTIIQLRNKFQERVRTEYGEDATLSWTLGTWQVFSGVANTEFVNATVFIQAEDRLIKRPVVLYATDRGGAGETAWLDHATDAWKTRLQAFERDLQFHLMSALDSGTTFHHVDVTLSKVVPTAVLDGYNTSGSKIRYFAYYDSTDTLQTTTPQVVT